MEKRTTKKKTKKAASAKPAVAHTPEALVEQGNIALSSMKIELAAQFFSKALELSPDDTNIMDALSDVLLQMGDQNLALELLQRSTSMAPSANPYKWCYLAQLQTGEDALLSYRTGINLLAGQLAEGGTGNENVHVIQRQIAKAHCCIADLFLTDLCYDDNAEGNCEAAIQASFSVEAGNLDAMQALASLRLSQQRPQDASKIMEEVYERINAIREKISARTVIEEITGAPDPVDMQDAPETEFCISTAKLLIECAGKNPMHLENAMTLIEDLLQEDDENVELWYMMGVASLSQEPYDLESARFHLDRAKEMLDEMMKEYVASGADPNEFPYSCQVGLVEDHLRILEEKESAMVSGEGGIVTNVGASAGADAMLEDMVEEEEWSDCDDDDDA